MNPLRIVEVTNAAGRSMLVMCAGEEEASRAARTRQFVKSAPASFRDVTDKLLADKLLSSQVQTILASEQRVCEIRVSRVGGMTLVSAIPIEQD